MSGAAIFFARRPTPGPGGDPFAGSAWSADRLAACCQSPLSAVWSNWPYILAALRREGIADKPTQIAAAATTAVETAHTFLPIEEYRNADGSIPAIWWTYSGGPTFHGRGDIQITHDYNYRAYGTRLGIDLLNNPDLALDPGVAASILALYFSDHGIPAAARAGAWQTVRRLVQGGLAGYDVFIQHVGCLEA